MKTQNVVTLHGGCRYTLLPTIVLPVRILAYDSGNTVAGIREMITSRTQASSQQFSLRQPITQHSAVLTPDAPAYTVLRVEYCTRYDNKTFKLQV